MQHFTPFSALAGGALIGLAASLLLLTHGRIAGVSGVFGRLFDRGEGAKGFRVAFLAGLVIAGVVARLLRAPTLPAVTPSLAAAAVAGLLVGLGTRLGNGCTSGHGVCGLSRLSVRSLVATLTFIATGVLTVAALRGLGIGLGVGGGR